jgi:hypothetical protein
MSLIRRLTMRRPCPLYHRQPTRHGAMPVCDHIWTTSTISVIFSLLCTTSPMFNLLVLIIQSLAVSSRRKADGLRRCLVNLMKCYRPGSLTGLTVVSVDEHQDLSLECRLYPRNDKYDLEWHLVMGFNDNAVAVSHDVCRQWSLWGR